jgi:hypothetical protein
MPSQPSPYQSMFSRPTSPQSAPLQPLSPQSNLLRSFPSPEFLSHSIPPQLTCVVCDKSPKKEGIQWLHLDELERSSKAGCHRCFILLEAAKCFIFNTDSALSEWTLLKESVGTHLSSNLQDHSDPTIEFFVPRGMATSRIASWTYARCSL